MFLYNIYCEKPYMQINYIKKLHTSISIMNDVIGTFSDSFHVDPLFLCNCIPYNLCKCTLCNRLSFEAKSKRPDIICIS